MWYGIITYIVKSMKIKYEVILWVNFFIKNIPGQIGCYVRNWILPYKNGRNVKVWEYCQIDSPRKLELGSNVSINRNCILNAAGGIKIGNDTLIGPNVIIYSQNHRFDVEDKLIREQGYILKKVVIGNNVWIAARVTILPGVTIGNNCVIGSNTLVSKDIPSNSLVVGNPGKVVRTINAES